VILSDLAKYQRHEASGSLSATAELLVMDVMIIIIIICRFLSRHKS